MTYSLAWPGKARENQSKVDYGGKYPACRTQTETNPLQFSLKSCTGGTEIKGTRNHLSSTQQPNYHWRTNPVIGPKLHNPGAIRFCSDMRVPNTAILRSATEALTVEDIKFKHEGATVFSVLNMNEGLSSMKTAGTWPPFMELNVSWVIQGWITEQSPHKTFLTKQWTTLSQGYKVCSTSETIS